MANEFLNSMMTEYGFSVGNVAGQTHTKLLVSGLGRSGTSAIGSILKHLGYYVGDVERVTTNEDKSLQNLLAKNLHDEIIEELNRRANTYPLIAWKDPKLIGSEGIKLIARLPNDWGIILTSRDPTSIAMRLSRQHGTNIAKNLEDVLSRQNKLLSAIALIRTKPVFVVSYEKLLANPEKTIMGLLIDINPNLLEQVDISKLWKSIRGDQAKYIAHSEKHKSL